MEYLEDTISSKERINSLFLSLKNQLSNGEFKDLEEKIAKNAQDAYTKVHTLKGVSGNLGAFELFDILTMIDAKYKKDDIVTQEDIQNLQKAKQKLIEKLDTIQEIKSSDRSLQTLSHEQLLELFKEVKYSLSQDQKVQDQKIEILYKNLQQKVDKQELQKWKEYFDEFDFDEAYEMMQGWKI
jgi:hypothetical protein